MEQIVVFVQDSTRQMQPHFYQAITLADHYLVLVEYKMYEQVPSLQQMNRFQKFLLLNAILIGLVIVWNLLTILNPVSMYRLGLKYLFKLPMVKRKLQVELEKGKKQFMDSYPEKQRAQLKTIPYSPVKPDFGNEGELESAKGYLSGSRYPEKKHSDFVVSLAKQFSYSNPLHLDLHPYVKQMEIEVIKMCARMMNFYSEKNEAIGGFFSGGTESILMAILAYREYGYKYLGVDRPNLVISDTGHAAALKAADMFGLEVKIVKSNSQYQMDISDMKRKIDRNTVGVYTSYPNYPYGTVDPIDQIAYICKKKGIPVHVDMCLGGFLVPFLKKENGEPMLRIPEGVTSISMDCHKYGLAGKGSSVLLFSSEKYRKEHLFVTIQWPGGLYGTLGIAGSRSGTTVASAWISMMKLGVKGYTKNALNVQHATKTLATELKKLGFKVFGEPQICTIGFSHPIYDITFIKMQMKKKGWNIPMIQKPIALHFSFTPLNSLKINQMVSDFISVVEMAKSLPKQKSKKKFQNAEVELYGTCAMVPDDNTKKIIMENVLDMFLDI